MNCKECKYISDNICPNSIKSDNEFEYCQYKNEADLISENQKLKEDKRKLELIIHSQNQKIKLLNKNLKLYENSKIPKHRLIKMLHNAELENLALKNKQGD